MNGWKADARQRALSALNRSGCASFLLVMTNIVTINPQELFVAKLIHSDGCKRNFAVVTTRIIQDGAHA